MKFVFASDSFKGTLSSQRTAELLTEAAKEVFPDCVCCGVPVADGGEGTVEAVLAAVKGEQIPVRVHGPYMEELQASYGRIDENRAILAMADASGLPLVPPEKRNPLFTTTYGTGELIREALLAGARDITIAIGGSATNDGGMGCMNALGVRFLDRKGQELKGIGANLREVDSIDLSGLMPEVRSARFTVMCDVEAPLCGEKGAVYAFGRQKGASLRELEELERGMQNYAEVLNRTFGGEIRSLPGGGAAGGLGAALHLFLHGEMKSGIDRVLDLISFDSLLEGADCVITGEGKADGMTVYGKVMSGVGRRSKAHGLPVLAIVGGMGEGAERVYECGVDSMITTINSAMPIEDALEQAESLYRSAARRLMRILAVGYGLHAGPREK